VYRAAFEATRSTGSGMRSKVIDDNNNNHNHNNRLNQRGGGSPPQLLRRCGPELVGKKVIISDRAYKMADPSVKPFDSRQKTWTSNTVYKAICSPIVYPWLLWRPFLLS